MGLVLNEKGDKERAARMRLPGGSGVFPCCGPAAAPSGTRQTGKYEPSSSLLSGAAEILQRRVVVMRLTLAGALPEKVKLNYVFTRPALRQIKEMLCGVLFSDKMFDSQ
ncbi:hypothetical protein [Neisseria dentiae]|uniref:hypothetical protein n=1 Tax=Neisseria dentiae TaxID=194197 RepID=UPI0035A10284